MRKLVKTEEYLKREKEIIGTTTVDMRGPVLRRGKGAVIIDIDGNEYLDFISQIGLVNTGHTPKFVALAIKQQTGQLHACISADWPYQTEIVIGGKKMEVSRVALAEKLVELTDKIMPFKKRVYFEVSGATTVNLALKIAKYTHLKNSGFSDTEIEKAGLAKKPEDKSKGMCRKKYLGILRILIKVKVSNFLRLPEFK